MKHIYDIVSNFSTLKEYTEFMEQLVEKSAAGDEISRGMNKHDKSKQEKKQVLTKEVKKNANGSSTEKHYDHIDPGVEEQQEPEAPPQPLPPGTQVKIGNKQIDQQSMKPKTVELNISGEKDKIDLKPTMKKDPRLAMR